MKEQSDHGGLSDLWSIFGRKPDGSRANAHPPAMAVLIRVTDSLVTTLSVSFLPIADGGGLVTMGHPPVGLSHIQNVSYRSFIFQMPGFAKISQRGSWRFQGQDIISSIWAKLSCDKIHHNYKLTRVWFATNTVISKRILAPVLNVTAFSLM